MKLNKIILVITLLIASSTAVHSAWQNIKVIDGGHGALALDIAIDSTDKPHICFDGGFSDLKYAYENDDGNITVFPTSLADLDSSNGKEAAITVDDDDSIHFLYNINDGGSYEITRSLFKDGQWAMVPEHIDNTPVVSDLVSLDIDTYKIDGTNHVFQVHWRGASGGQLGERGCVYSTEYSGFFDYEQAAQDNNEYGKECRIAIDKSNGKVFVAYIKGVNPNYRLECKSKDYDRGSADWSFLPGGVPYDNAGTSLTDSMDMVLYEGNPHIVFSDSASSDIRYSYHDGSIWHTEFVGEDHNGGAGQDIKIAINKHGRPFITYYNAIATGLRIAHHNGNDWVYETIESNGGAPEPGLYNSLAVDSLGNPHVVYSVVTGGDSTKYVTKIFYSPPDVTIDSPSADDTFSSGESITFEATASDLQDSGDLSDNVRWESDVDGDLNHSEPSGSITVDDLSTGEHTITAYVIDSDDDRGEAQIKIIVGSAAYDELEANKDVRVGNNKFDPTTGEQCNIMFKLSREQNVSVKVYDLVGNLVSVLYDNVIMAEGDKSVVWDGLNKENIDVPNGIYYVVVEGDDWRDIKKVAIVKGNISNK